MAGSRQRYGHFLVVLSHLEPCQYLKLLHYIDTSEKQELKALDAMLIPELELALRCYQ